MRRFGGLVAAGAVSLMLAAAAQEASAQTPAAPVGSGWTFNLTPYLWLPWLKVDLGYNLPRGLGGRLPTSLSVGPGELYTNLRFGGTFTAEARYDRFSVLTDFIYLNEGFDFSHTRLRSVDFDGAASQPIRAGAAVSASSVAKTTIWTLAGGYTVLQGDWGNLDAIAGFRYLGVDATTGFTLSAAFTGPLGNSAALTGSDNVSANRAIWNGIGGVRGRIRIPNSDFFVPYYADIGAGGSDLTWQVATGIGYQSGRAGLSAQYRYMSFDQGSSSVVRKVSMSGPMIAVNISF